jgi:hypothetical protein
MTLTIHDTTMTSDQTDCTARHGGAGYRLGAAIVVAAQGLGGHSGGWAGPIRGSSPQWMWRMSCPIASESGVVHLSH